MNRLFNSYSTFTSAYPSGVHIEQTVVIWSTVHEQPPATNRPGTVPEPGFSELACGCQTDELSSTLHSSRANKTSSTACCTVTSFFDYLVLQVTILVEDPASNRSQTFLLGRVSSLLLQFTFTALHAALQRAQPDNYMRLSSTTYGISCPPTLRMLKL